MAVISKCLIGRAIGAVHVLPGTVQSSPKDNGEYDSTRTATMTLEDLRDWLYLEICRFPNTRHSVLGRAPLAAGADLGGDDAGSQVIDVEAFRINILSSERRQLGRTGVNLFSIGCWNDVFWPMTARGAGQLTVKHNPCNMSQIWALADDCRSIQVFAPPMEEFAKGRELTGWRGFVPRQKSTGGRQILGRTSEMGQRDIRRLLITAAMAVFRWAIRKGPPPGAWLAKMLVRKPRMLVATALANKLTRTV